MFRALLDTIPNRARGKADETGDWEENPYKPHVGPLKKRGVSKGKGQTCARFPIMKLPIRTQVSCHFRRGLVFLAAGLAGGSFVRGARAGADGSSPTQGVVSGRTSAVKTATDCARLIFRYATSASSALYRPGRGARTHATGGRRQTPQRCGASGAGITESFSGKLRGGGGP